MRLGVDPRKADQMVRGTVNLPTARARPPASWSSPTATRPRPPVRPAPTSSAADDLIEKVAGGWLDFDAVVATPDLMGKVGRLGKVLGPRGLMPNPKTGTVTMDVAKAVTDIKGGKIEFRVDKHANLHFIIGKASFDEKALVENYAAALEEVLRLKPSASKGRYIIKAPWPPRWARASRWTPSAPATAFHNGEFVDVSEVPTCGQVVRRLLLPGRLHLRLPHRARRPGRPLRGAPGWASRSTACRPTPTSPTRPGTTRPTRSARSLPDGRRPHRQITNNFKRHAPGQGLADRGTFVVDPDGIIQVIEVTAEGIGRNAAELVRKVKAAQYVRNHPGEVCPAKWEEGDDTLAPSLDLVGKISVSRPPRVDPRAAPPGMPLPLCPARMASPAPPLSPAPPPGATPCSTRTSPPS
jgi:large subunit ribosomal protein L1